MTEQLKRQVGLDLLWTYLVILAGNFTVAWVFTGDWFLQFRFSLQQGCALLCGWLMIRQNR